MRVSAHSKALIKGSLESFKQGSVILSDRSGSGVPGDRSSSLGWGAKGVEGPAFRDAGAPRIAPQLRYELWTHHSCPFHHRSPIVITAGIAPNPPSPQTPQPESQNLPRHFADYYLPLAH